MFFTDCKSGMLIGVIFFSWLSGIMAQEEIEEVLLKQWDSFIEHWQNEETSALGQYYIEDAVHIPPKMTINEGRESIMAFYQMLFDNHIGSKYQHQIISFDRCGTSIIEHGRFTVKWTRNDQTEWIFRARCVTHWVYDQQVGWQIKLFTFNEPPNP